MNIVHALFSLDGRTGRKTFWLSILMIAVITVPVTIYLMMQIMGGGPTADMQKMLAYFSLGSLIVFGYPLVAIYGKRLHDRNKSAWLMALYLVPAALDPMLTFTDLGGTLEQPSAMRLGLSFFMVIIGIWFLIELGFLRGTPGPNKYGEDPLPAQPGTAQA